MDSSIAVDRELRSQEGIAKDLTAGVEKPIWPLSSYGTAKNEPTLIATLDESPEELRWKAVLALGANNGPEYVGHALIYIRNIHR